MQLRCLQVYKKDFFERSANIVRTETIPTIEHSTLSKDEKYARKKVYEALVRANDVYNEKTYIQYSYSWNDGSYECS